jgi:hypothetical protein
MVANCGRPSRLRHPARRNVGFRPGRVPTAAESGGLGPRVVKNDDGNLLHRVVGESAAVRWLLGGLAAPSSVGGPAGQLPAGAGGALPGAPANCETPTLTHTRWPSQTKTTEPNQSKSTAQAASLGCAVSSRRGSGHPRMRPFGSAVGCWSQLRRRHVLHEGSERVPQWCRRTVRRGTVSSRTWRAR